MTNHFVCKLSVVCLLLALMSLPMMAQTGNQGSIEGVVMDPSGAVVAGANLTAINSATGARFTTASDSSGIYSFPIIPVGTYQVVAEHAGFAKLTEKDVVVNVGARLTLPLTMRVASQSEAVTVMGTAPLVETTRSQVSSTVTEQQISSLPVNGRNFIDFALLTPGVNRDPRLGDISFGGLRGTQNSLMVDGSDNNNNFFGQTTGRTGSGRAPYQFSQDAVQEFQVNTNGYSAELGRAGGAVINVITKSGSNQVHGGMFWYYRDRSMDAGNPFIKLNNEFAAKPAAIHPPYHFNQFGGSLGGPVIKDKLFWFFDYDGQRNTQPNVVFYTPPVIAAPSPFQTLALNYLSARSGSWNSTANENDYLTKLDWTINAKNQLSFRVNDQRFTGQGQEFSGPQVSSEHTGASLVQTDNAALQVTSSITPNWINVGRFAFVHDNEPGQANSINPEATIRDSKLSNGQTILQIGRNFFSPRATREDRYEYGDAVTYAIHHHTLKTGVDVIHDRIFNFFPGTSNGSFTFNTLENFGRSLCLGGLATTPAVACQPLTSDGSSYTQNFFGPGTSGPITKPNLFDFAVYAQDEWRIRRNLTLNLGVRYDIDTYDQPTVQNPTALAAGINTASIHKDYNNVAPRVGFAWTPSRSDDRLVVRGGYGVFYSRTPSILLSTAFSQNGLSVQNRTTGNVALFPSYPNSLCGAVNAAGTSCAPPAILAVGSPPIIMVFAPNYQQPYVQQFNLGTEYQVAKDLSVSVGYLGVKGTRLQQVRDINQFFPTPQTIFLGTNALTYLKYSALRPNPNFNRIESIQSEAASNYNALVVQVNKRFSHNFQAQVAYTYSHAIDNAPDATAVVPQSSDDAKLVQSSLQPSLDRASSANDVRNRMVVNGVWDLNYGHNLPGFARAVISNWQLSGIFTAQGGQPFSGLVSSDLNNDGNRSTDRQPGVGRDTFRLPANYSLDPRITRTVKMGESMRLQVFAEAFNILNHFNYFSAKTNEYKVGTGAACAAGATPCLLPLNLATAGANAFALPISVLGGTPVERTIQLGARFSF